MAITAKAGDLLSTIEPRRPSWADMHKHYPGKEIERKELYAKIGGGLTGGHDKKWLANTCAVRMSYALLRSGFSLARTPDAQASKLGADRRWYWLRVADLRAELYARFKGYDAELAFDLVDEGLRTNPEAIEFHYQERKAKATEFFRDHIVPRNGIIVFRVKGWSNATGHFTLWDNARRKLAYAPDHDNELEPSFYPWLTKVEINNDTGEPYLVQVEQIQFWELK